MSTRISNLDEFMFTRINEAKYFCLHNAEDLIKERALQKELRDKTINEEQKFKLETKSKIRQKSNYKIPNNVNKTSQANKSSHIIIQQENKLFWAFYIFLYSFEDFSLLSHIFKTEQDFKIKSIIKIREHKNKLKIHKMKRNMIEDELLNEKKISIKTLNCLALIYKLNIIYIKGRTYYLMNYDEGDKGTAVEPDISVCKNIIEEKDNVISILNLTQEMTKNIIDTYYHIENIEKPINAFSYYKTQDLLELANKLKIETMKNGKQKMKKDLYTEINIHF